MRQHPSSVCPVVSGFVSGALRWVPRGKAQRLPQRKLPYATWEVGRGG